jgi:hypothetical protein
VDGVVVVSKLGTRDGVSDCLVGCGIADVGILDIVGCHDGYLVDVGVVLGTGTVGASKFRFDCAKTAFTMGNNCLYTG